MNQSTVYDKSHSRFRNGVMLNAYPDSIGDKLGDAISVLKWPEFKGTFTLFYILPSFFNSDLDRGFSIIDYGINPDMASVKDLQELDELNISLKFDIVLNHLSVASPQFKDLLKNGKDSGYKDFFINWNEFWEGYGELNEDDVIVPNKEYLDILFMRKPGLPVLKIRFSDGQEKPFWNTFYQEQNYTSISQDALSTIPNLSKDQCKDICIIVNHALKEKQNIDELDFGIYSEHKSEILAIVKTNPVYLGQIDLNAKSPGVWEFYKQVFSMLASYGCKIVRLDAFAYLHKEIGKRNFFNKPGTWEYLARINEMAGKHNLVILPEIHAEYGTHIHNEVAEAGYMIYDFFLPGLMIHTIEKKSGRALTNWILEIISSGFKTVNMLGCHDGIPVLDLKGKEKNGKYYNGLLSANDIEEIMALVLYRGGRVKNIYDAKGNKISYYQVNATYFSALGEDENKLLLARAIQMFIPGIPQVWYLDLFAGTNDYKAADKAGEGGHKEINRTNLSLTEIKERIAYRVVKEQIELIRFRNSHEAFHGEIEIMETPENQLEIKWVNGPHYASLFADLSNYEYTIQSS